MKKEGEKDLEEEVYEVPRLPIKLYRRKLGEAMDAPQIRTHYEDLMLETTSDPDLVDTKTELGYLLKGIKGTLVIFQVIDELELLKELGPDALATSILTPKGGVIIIFQEILFRMNPDILAIVLQQQLDQFFFISEGSSPSEAYELAIHPDRERVEQAIKTQLDRELKQLVKQQGKNKHIKVDSKTTKKSDGRRDKRKYHHPGKEELRRLIIKYQAKLYDIAKDPDINASQPTLSAWINKDPELKRLAKKHRKARASEEQRRARARKSERPKISEIKSLDELKTLLTSEAIKLITWRDLPFKLHKALVIELSQKIEKELSELTKTDYIKTKLAVLNQRPLAGFYAYWSRENKTDSVATIFILEKLGLVEKTIGIPKEVLKEVAIEKPESKRPEVSEIKSLEQLKKYPGDETLKKLIVKYQGNLRKIANDSSVQVMPSKVMTWINDNPELRRLALKQRQHRKSRKTKVRVPSNPGKEILEALLINYKGDLKKMAGNPNINTDVETLRSWIKEERLESLVG